MKTSYIRQILNKMIYLIDTDYMINDFIEVVDKIQRYFEKNDIKEI